VQPSECATRRASCRIALGRRSPRGWPHPLPNRSVARSPMNMPWRASFVFGTEAKEKIYARPACGSNKQFLMGGDDLTFPVRVYSMCASAQSRAMIGRCPLLGPVGTRDYFSMIFLTVFAYFFRFSRSPTIFSACRWIGAGSSLPPHAGHTGSALPCPPGSEYQGRQLRALNSCREWVQN